MKLSFLLILIFSLSASANECSKEYKFKIKGMSKTFCFYEKEKALVSKKCVSSKCRSISVLKSQLLKDVKLKTSELSGGKNPSTLLCKKIDGKLILGISELGHQQFFCQFNDKSMISTSSLMVQFEDMRDAKKAKK